MIRRERSFEGIEVNFMYLDSSQDVIGHPNLNKEDEHKAIAETVKKYSDIIIICGRYEGIDSRIKEVFSMDDISVGPFVLTGGELPAMIIIDCMSRQIEGVLGDFASLEESRISSGEMYTRPEVLTYKNKKYKVPKILLSGNHKAIEEWRKGSK